MKTDNHLDTFIYYMVNVFSERECAKVFADASCGSDYIWSLFEKACSEYYGRLGGAMVFYADYLDVEKQIQLREHAYKHYNAV